MQETRIIPLWRKAAYTLILVIGSISLILLIHQNSEARFYQKYSTPGPAQHQLLTTEISDGQLLLYLESSQGKHLITQQDSNKVLPNQIMLSPDNKWVSLVKIDNQNDHFDLTGASIWLINTQTGKERLLIHADQDFLVTNPLWSPDSTKIAYAKIFPGRSISQTVIAELWLTDLEGNETLLVANDSFGPAFFFGESFAIAWTENGQAIQYFNEIGDEQVYEVDILTRNIRLVHPSYVATIEQYLQRIEQSRQQGYSGMTMPIVGLPDYQGWSGGQYYSVAYLDDYYGSSWEGSGGHPGTDITYGAGCPGSEVVSVADGMVWNSINTWQSNCHGGTAFGNYVIVRSDNLPAVNGYPGGTFYFLYGHLYDVSVVPGNFPIERDDPIGHIGSTGASSNPHLHFQLEPDLGQMHPWWFENGGCDLSDHCDISFQGPAMDNTDNPMMFVQANIAAPGWGVTACEHDNLQGTCELFTVDDPFLDENPIDKLTISSLQIPELWQVKLFQDKYFGGTSSDTYYGPTTVTANMLGTFNDQAESLRIGAPFCRPGDPPRLFEVGVTTPQDDCSPEDDNAEFVVDVTLPDGTAVSPGDALVKTWRLRNTGSTTWGSGYQLVFLSGEQMGAPAFINVPATAPNQEVNLSVNLTAPLNNGTYRGNWQLRNPQGVFFGPTIWLEINVTSGSNYITVLMADPPSPANANLVHIYARAENFPNFRAMRLKIDGAVSSEIGAPEIQFDWYTSGYATGDHSIVVEVADQTDTSWNHPEVRGMTYTLTGTGGSNNHAPNRPSPTSPYDWYVNIGSPPQLCGQGSDPDGDSLQYQFEAIASVGTYNSGWVNNSCHTFGTVEPGTYEWKIKTRDTSQAESEWSESWHFSVETSGVTITELYFEPLDPDSEQVRIRACTTGHAGVGITLNARVNDANNGSDNGQWHIIKELGVPCFNEIDAPVWNTLEYGDGDHLVRIMATAVNPSASDMLDGIYPLPHRRPAAPRLIAPVPLSQENNEPIYLNSRTVTFLWEPTIRANNYTLHVSTNPSPKDDPNPILRQVLGSSTTQYTHTFAQDHSTLYWQVTATNDRGSNHSGAQRFGIDRVMPACAVEPLAPVTYETVFQVGWNGTDNLAGIRSVDIQYLDSDHGGWSNWLTAVPVTTTYSLFTGLPGHAYAFRCRAMDNAGNSGIYPANGDTSILVDPTSRPPSPWWDNAYAYKRNLTILNNMPSIELPIGYPIHLHFDSSTTPTAAELYTASQSTPKCDDLRIIYNDSTQVNRVVQSCSTSAIDIWFRSQVAVPGGSVNNTSHQMYYGNNSPGSPPADPNQVWYPYDENDTEALYFFQEGSGATANDSSGHGRHCTIDPTVQWMPSKFGQGLRFNRANAGDSESLTCGAAILTSFTVEFWYKPDQDDGGRIAGQLSGGGGNNWLLQNINGHIRLDVWPCPSCGSSDVQSDFDLRNALYVGQWNHIAVTFNGGNEVRFYINGALDSTKYLPQSGINTYTIPQEIGSVEGISQVKANMGTFRITNGVRTSFPYGTYAAITNEPATAAGFPIEPPASGTPELALLNLRIYPNPEGGILVQSVIENQGNRDTENGFFTDLYLDHLPTGPGDYTNSIQYWVNDSIAAGETVTLTTVLTDDPLNGLLYAQLDSTGVINEADNENNIFSVGRPVCVAVPDDYEADDTWASSTPLSLNTMQAHNIHRMGDEDWFAIQVTAGQPIRISTTNLDHDSDTYLFLYASNGTTLLQSNDDYNGSLGSYIEWTPTTTGTYYVMVRHWNPNASGCGTGYTIIFGDVQVFLPVVQKP